jgi:hypothetical protein
MVETSTLSSWRRDEAGYMLGGDLVEAEVCEFTERHEVLDALLVKANRVRLGRLGGRDERKERLLGEILERGCGFLLSNANSPFARAARCAASICSATRLFGCLVLSRTWLPFQVNLYHQFSEPFCL